MNCADFNIFHFVKDLHCINSLWFGNTLDCVQLYHSDRGVLGETTTFYITQDTVLRKYKDWTVRYVEHKYHSATVSQTASGNIVKVIPKNILTYSFTYFVRLYYIKRINLKEKYFYI